MPKANQQLWRKSCVQDNERADLCLILVIVYFTLMTHNKIKYIALAFFCILVILIITIRTQQTKPVNKSDTTLISGTYLDIEKIVTQNSRGSSADTSYNLYLNEQKQPYLISDIASGCFMHRIFEKEISEGSPVKIYVNGNKLVYCVIANNKEYLSFDCQKRVVDNNKIYEPIAFVVIFALIVGGIYLKRNM